MGEWGRFRSALLGAHAAMGQHLDTIDTSNILRVSRALPWGEVFRAPLLKAWRTEMHRTLHAHRRDTRAGLMRKKAPASYADVPLTAAERRALDWMTEHGLRLVENLTVQSRRAVMATVMDGLRKGASVPAMVRRIKDVVGLNERYAQAVATRRDRLESMDLEPEKIDRDIARYTNKLVRARAENVIRTEVVTARNQGRMMAWQELQAEGELPVTAMKVWIAAPSDRGALSGKGPKPRLCEICAELGAQKPVLLREPFKTKDGSFMIPPAHPSCRCTVSLA